MKNELRPEADSNLRGTTAAGTLSFRPAACKVAEDAGCDCHLGERRFTLFGQEPQLVADARHTLPVAVLPGEDRIPFALVLDERGDCDVAARGADIADGP